LLHEQLAEVAACSRGRLVFVCGEAAIGKRATLWRRFCAEAASRPGASQLHRVHPLRIVLGELPRAASVARLELSGLSRDRGWPVVRTAHS
jgi:hypothetical protein